MKLDNCTALITGASSGIGREFARQLAGRAKALVLVARREDRLEELRAELTGKHAALQVHIFSTDLSKHKSVSELCESLEGNAITPDFLINNAGLGDRGSFPTSDFGRVNDMMQVNVVSLTLLTRKLLPAMIAAGHGAILHVSSCASFMPMPGFAVYAATKAYVTSFSEALRAELRGTGVTVTALCPGPVHTEFDAVAMRPDARDGNAPEFTYVSVEEVVSTGLAAVTSGRAVTIPGVPMKLAMLLVRLTPRPLLRLAWRFAA